MARSSLLADPRAFEARVLAILRALGVGEQASLGVGCSGGPDSAALAVMAMTLSRQGALGPITLVHVDHGLRPDSARDAELVRAQARDGGARCHVASVASRIDRTRSSLERAARDARYAAFDDAITALALDAMLLAHTASDQAETVLMRILRGTGVAGLAAIPSRRGPYLRPLLAFTRQEIEAYVAALAITTASDPMNTDAAFLRSRVRHHWLPALRAENPRLDRALCDLAGSARDGREVLDFAAELLLELARADARDTLAIPALVRAPDAVLCRALALAASALGMDLEARHQQALAALVRRPSAGTLAVDLPGSRAVREYDTLRFEPRHARERAATGSLPGPTDRETAGPAATGLRVDGPDGPYLVRGWQPGDRMRPARLRGRSRKLADLFIDAKLPRRLRQTARIVVRRRDGVIEWAEYIGPAHGSTARVSLTSPSGVASNNMSD